MKKSVLKKGILLLVVVVLLVMGLTGCNVNLGPVLPPISTTGTVYLVLSGNYTYDLKMDGYTYFFNKPANTYTLPDVSIGNHTFEAIDATWGASWGYNSKTKYIDAGLNYVYLYPDI